MRFTHSIQIAVSLALIAAPRARAQDALLSRAYATRAELESLAVGAQRRAEDPASAARVREERLREASAARERLRLGDFQVGDRIVLRVDREATLTDTFTVTAARTVSLPNLADVSLEGVLRSELQQHLATQIARFLKDPVVHAQPLVRVAVLGQVRTPGFIYVPTHSLLSGVLASAGGLTPTADLRRVTVRRDGRTLLDTEGAARAMANGATLDDIAIRAGDEIVVDASKQVNWTTWLQAVALLAGATTTVVALTRR